MLCTRPLGGECEPVGVGGETAYLVSNCGALTLRLAQAERIGHIN